MKTMFDDTSSIQITPKDVKARIEKKEPIVLLDVREPWEVAVARMEGATHIPLGELGRRFSELDSDAEIVVYCHMGVRSLRAVQFLRQQGLEHVWNLSGGIDAWSLEVDPAVPRYR